MSLHLNLSNGGRVAATQLSPRGSRPLTWQAPSGKAVTWHSKAGDLASANQAATMRGASVGAQNPASQMFKRQLGTLAAQPRPIGERRVALQGKDSARLYSTAAGNAKQNTRAEARRLLENYRSGRVEPLRDLYPREDSHFASWFAINVPAKFRNVTALRPVEISQESLLAFERQVDAKISGSAPGDSNLTAELKEMTAAFVRQEAASPENRSLFGVTLQTRREILGREDLEPEQKAAMFVFLGDLKDWGYLQGGDADLRKTVPNLDQSLRFVKNSIAHVSRTVLSGDRIADLGDGRFTISLADNVAPQLTPDRLAAALDSAERLAVGTSALSEALTHGDAGTASRTEGMRELLGRARKYAETSYAADAPRDRIPGAVESWVNITNANLPAGLPPVSAFRPMTPQEWRQIEEDIENHIARLQNETDRALLDPRKVSPPLTTGPDGVPDAIKKVIDFRVGVSSGENWEADISFQMGVMIGEEMGNDEPVQAAAASSLFTAMLRKYMPSDQLVLISDAGMQDWNTILDVAKDLARRAY